VEEIWRSAAGQPADLTVLPLLPIPPGAHLEQLLWHGPGATAAPLSLVVAGRSRSGRVETLRLLQGDLLVADLRVRHGAARPDAPHALLRTAPGPGATCTRHFAVTPAVTTDHVPGAVPVLSTPAMIAFMEDTAADVLRPHFAPAAASLGTWIGVRHTGPALAGQEVTVRAVLADARGRRYLFDVEATVDGRPIGDGQVAQTLVTRPPAR